MPDREKVISKLKVVYEYLRHFENTAKMGEWVADALALIDTQYKLILELQNLISIGTKMMNGGEVNDSD